ncbi:MAG: GHKL domain-containing protein [Ruminococcus sp.]|nr:GHKL domain-containing protein [Ruminococcus sp.]
MVKRLQRRFVMINMAILTLVMCAVFCGVYLMMARSEQKELQRVVHQALAASWTDGKPVAEQYQMYDLVYLTLYSDTREMMVASGSSVQELETVTATAWRLIDSGEPIGKTLVGDGSYYYEYRSTQDGLRLVMGSRAAEQDILRRLSRNFRRIGPAALIGLLIISILLARWEIRPIAAAWETQRNFVSDASHELKTPLAVIATNTDLVLANPDSTIAQQRRWLDYMKDETVRMSRLVANLLFIAKVDAHEIKAARAEVDFSAWLEELCMEYETDVFEAGYLLDYQIAPHITEQLDQEKMRRVLDILLDNAVQYSTPKTEIRIRLFQDKLGRVCFLMSNQTEPLTKEHTARLFDRFYRVDRSRARNTGGYGLGLNIAKCIVELHEGTISASCDETGKLVISIIF